MGRKTIRVDIPFRQPDEMIQLAQSILSYISGNPNPALDSGKIRKLADLTDSASSNNTLGKNLDAQAQVARQRRDTALGIADGQSAATPDTILNLVNYVRDQLMVQNECSEEVLQQYGFNVFIGTAKSPSRSQKTVDATT